MNSLNCWYVIIPAMFVLCAIVGWKRYDVKCHSLQILMTYTDKIRDAISSLEPDCSRWLRLCRCHRADAVVYLSDKHSQQTEV